MNLAKKKRYNLLHRPFEEARAYVQILGLQKLERMARLGLIREARPDDIPTDPRATYKDKEWKGMGNWLGTGAFSK